jgi:uncharacterized protein YndB with AHSA1/START domain
MNATALLVPQPSRQRQHGVRPETVERHIVLNVTVSADKRRLFDALTLPEYREAWLVVPGSHSHCYTVVSETGGAFRLDHFAEGGLEFSIAGAYRVCRRSKMAFTWRKSNATSLHVSAPETLVTIRLQGAFSDTTVSLDHSGHFSPTEYRWHSEMWSLSLNKLRALFCSLLTIRSSTSDPCRPRPTASSV